MRESDGALRPSDEGGWLHRGPAFLERPAPRSLSLASTVTGATRGDITLRDCVYRQLLDLCPLTEGHSRNLQDRGLTDTHGYASMPKRRAEIVSQLRRDHSDDHLMQVPGFYQADGRLRLAGAIGIIIPCRDLEGRIFGLKIRRDDGDAANRYTYLSSKKHGGPGAESGAHVPLHAAPGSAVIVTEGELKADIVTALGDNLAISVPGVTTWRTALPVLERLAPARVQLAFDADFRTKAPVRLALRDLHAELVRRGYNVAFLVWSPELGKGLDDVMAAGHQPAVATLEELDLETDDIPAAASSPAEPEKPAEFGALLLGRHRWFYTWERLHVYRDGVYTDGEQSARRLVQDMAGPKATKRLADDVVYWLKTATYIDGDQVNQDERINVENGLLDTRTLELHPHTPDVLCTVRLPILWDPYAYHARGDQFLNEVLPDAETRACLEEFSGYALAPDCSFAKALMLTGTGANGKSIMLKWLTRMLGLDNTSAVKLQAFTDNRFHAAEIVGKIANVFADLPREAITEDDVFKMLVSGDAITIERKFARPFLYVNRAKLIFSANELPRTKDRSHAFFRRWLIVPFPNRFEGASDDKNLIEKLCTPDGLAYLLRLAVEGLRRLRAQGHFTESRSMRDAISSYRSTSDSVWAFVQEAIEVVDGAWMDKGALYGSYRDWADSNGRKPLDIVPFFKMLRNHAPFSEKRIGTQARTRVICGIRLKREDRP